MAANPALVVGLHGEVIPAPFSQELFALKRGGVNFEVDSVHTRSGKWSTSGTVFMSNLRMVFVAEKPDPSGLAAFDLPLVYIRNHKLNQPIFGCNNLAGEVWPAVEGGGPGGSLPPHNFKILFKEGGIGTFYPLYYTLTEKAVNMYNATQNTQAGRDEASGFMRNVMSSAFVDPNDPTTVYLVSQPVDESQRLATQPKYAPNYGQDEKYEDMGWRP